MIWLYVALAVVVLLIGAAAIAIRVLRHQRRVIHWCDEREGYFAGCMKDMLGLSGSNFYHPLPGEWDVNFDTLRRMWQQVADMERQRGVLFKEFQANLLELQAWEAAHPVPTIRWKPW